MREVPVAVEYIGLVRVRVVDHDASLCVTTLLTPDGDVAAGPGSVSEVTAADVTAIVSGQFGEIEVPLEVAAGASVDFDPIPWIPAALTVVDVPAGSTLRVFVEGLDGAMIERELSVPPGIGSLDPQTGVVIAPPQRVDSLVGGLGGVFVEHPGLGEGNASVALEPGAANATTFRWRELPGRVRIKAAYDDWATRSAVVKRRAGSTAGAFVALAIGSGIASGFLWGVSAQAGVEADGSKSLALTAADAASPDLNGIEALRQDYDTAAARHEGTTVAASITAGLAGAGLVLSFTLGAKGQRDVAALGDWDPSEIAPGAP